MNIYKNSIMKNSSQGRIELIKGNTWAKREKKGVFMSGALYLVQQNTEECFSSRDSA